MENALNVLITAPLALQQLFATHAQLNTAKPAHPLIHALHAMFITSRHLKVLATNAVKTATNVLLPLNVLNVKTLSSLRVEPVLPVTNTALNVVPLDAKLVKMVSSLIMNLDYVIDAVILLNTVPHAPIKTLAKIVKFTISRPLKVLATNAVKTVTNVLQLLNVLNVKTLSSLRLEPALDATNTALNAAPLDVKPAKIVITLILIQDYVMPAVMPSNTVPYVPIAPIAKSARMLGSLLKKNVINAVEPVLPAKIKLAARPARIRTVKSVLLIPVLNALRDSTAMVKEIVTAVVKVVNLAQRLIPAILANSVISI